MVKSVGKYREEIFENIKHINEFGQEFWYARELQRTLDYTQWRRFKSVIERAIESCDASGNMVPLGSGAEREVEDFMLTRYACYLIFSRGG